MAFALGQQVNLLRGLQAGPDKMFYSPSTQIFPETDSHGAAPTPATGDGKKMTGSLVICKSWSEVTQFYFSDIVSIPVSNKVSPDASDPASIRDASAFFPDRQQANQTLAEAFGIPSEHLSDPNVAFALVNVYLSTGLVTKPAEGAAAETAEKARQDIRGALFDLADQVSFCCPCLLYYFSLFHNTA